MTKRSVALVVAVACFALARGERRVAAISLSPVGGSTQIVTQACTFQDGSSVPGTCMFDEEFNDASTVCVTPGSCSGKTWIAEDNWLGPINFSVIPELTCIRHENVSVSGGNLVLSMTANSRASCPQTWPETTYYDTSGCTGVSGGPGCKTSFNPGQPTSYDAAVVSQLNFNFTYGRIDIRALFSGGTGPGTDISLWGQTCQSSLGLIDAYLSGFFAHAITGCRFPTTPGSEEMDIPEWSKASGNVLDDSCYVGASVGSPPSVGTFFGVPYYGGLWASSVVGQPFMNGATVSDSSVNWHVYTTIWTPQTFEFYVDGSPVNVAHGGSPSWIPSHPMFLMFWNEDQTTVTAATLPQNALIDYVRITCPPGVPCVVNHAP